MPTILSTVHSRFVIPLSLSDCSTATNKAAYASRNNDHVRDLILTPIHAAVNVILTSMGGGVECGAATGE